MFAEKQKLVADLEVYGAGGAAPVPEGEPAAAPAPAEAAPAPAAEVPAAWTKSFHKMHTGQHNLNYFYIYFIRFYS